MSNVDGAGERPNFPQESAGGTGAEGAERQKGDLRGAAVEVHKKKRGKRKRTRRLKESHKRQLNTSPGRAPTGLSHAGKFNPVAQKVQATDPSPRVDEPTEELAITTPPQDLQELQDPQLSVTQAGEPSSEDGLNRKFEQELEKLRGNGVTHRKMPEIEAVNQVNTLVTNIGNKLWASPSEKKSGILAFASPSSLVSLRDTSRTNKPEVSLEECQGKMLKAAYQGHFQFRQINDPSRTGNLKVEDVKLSEAALQRIKEACEKVRPEIKLNTATAEQFQAVAKIFFEGLAHKMGRISHNDGTDIDLREDECSQLTQNFLNKISKDVYTHINKNKSRCEQKVIDQSVSIMVVNALSPRVSELDTRKNPRLDG